MPLPTWGSTSSARALSAYALVLVSLATVTTTTSSTAVINIHDGGRLVVGGVGPGGSGVGEEEGHGRGGFGGDGDRDDGDGSHLRLLLRRLCGSAQRGRRPEGAAWCEPFVGVGIRNESVVMYDVVMALPTVLFVVFLASQLRDSVKKLTHSHGRNHIMITYYAFLWLVCILNVLRCGLQMWQSTPLNHVRLWNALWLATRFGMTFLEMSVVVFLAQGYNANVGASAGGQLARTLAVAGVVAVTDLLVKTALIFGGDVELFVEQQDARTESYYWAKWGYWAARNALFTVVYGIVVTLPHTKYRDLLPARPAFFKYAGVLLALYAVGTVAALCVAFGVTVGYCATGACNFLYYVGYPPLLYVTFLADFFREDDYELESAYYSELEDAGYFDDDIGNVEY